MGQKIHPNGLRVGIIRDWESKWYAEKDYATLLHEDLKIREYIEKRLVDASVSKVEIERAAKRVNISIHTAKPGMVIGKGGSEVEALRKQLNDITGKRVHINIIEIKRADLDAKLVAESHCTSTRRPCFIPSCTKTSNSTYTSLLALKELKHKFLDVLAVLTSLVQNITVKVLFLFILYVQTLIMHMQKLTQHW